MGTGTVGLADIYGVRSTVGGVMDPLSIQNPNGASVAPITQTASGGANGSGGGPALALVGIIVTFVMFRLALHSARDA